MERVDRARTSSATTAKPRPLSPARAASIAAFSASRLVCLAMASISWVDCRISPIFSVTLSIRSTSCCEVRLVSRVASTNSPRVAWVVWMNSWKLIAPSMCPRPS
ncbi:hypothetical protein D3C80_1474280 [compost metagenome]